MTVGTDKMGVVMNTCIFDLMGKWPVYGLATYIVAFVFIFLFCVLAFSNTARYMGRPDIPGHLCNFIMIVGTAAFVFIMVNTSDTSIVNTLLFLFMFLAHELVWHRRHMANMFTVNLYMELIFCIFDITVGIMGMLYPDGMRFVLADPYKRAVVRFITMVASVLMLMVMRKVMKPGNTGAMSRNRLFTNAMTIWLLICNFYFIFQYTVFRNSSMDGLCRAVNSVLIPLMLFGVSWMMYFYNVRIMTLLGFEESSKRDGLTGLYNRSSAQTMIEFRLAEGGALLMIDVDNFKSFNDRMGHSVGDDILRILADKIGNAFREEDIKGRYGGDEFFVFVRGIEGRTYVEERALQVCSSMNEVVMRNENVSVPVSVSIGICMVNPGCRDKFETLIKKADIALYRSKESGKNTCTFYSDEMRKGWKAAAKAGSVKEAEETEKSAEH